MSQTVELPRVEGPGSGLGGEWRVIVRNDDHNTFDHVAFTLARYIPGVNVPEGYAIADRIHFTGQALVWSGLLDGNAIRSYRRACSSISRRPIL